MKISVRVRTFGGDIGTLVDGVVSINRIDTLAWCSVDIDDPLRPGVPVLIMTTYKPCHIYLRDDGILLLSSDEIPAYEDKEVTRGAKS